MEVLAVGHFVITNCRKFKCPKLVINLVIIVQLAQNLRGGFSNLRN